MMTVISRMASDEPSDPAAEPANLRFLRRLVTGLTAVMIVGLLTIVALIVIRLLVVQPLPLPDAITLPAGTVATAFTRGPDWFAVVTDDNRILIFDGATGSLKQTLRIAP